MAIAKKRLVMDLDYFDLAWNGITRDKLEKLFDNCARGGFGAMFWSVMSMGYAEYHSKIIPVYGGQDRRIGSKRCAEGLRAFDGLAAGVELGKKYGIKIIPYYRMFDDYWPGCIDAFVDKIPGGWWESRCGNFQLRGWPCYHVPEIFDYKLRLLREIAGYGVDGILFGCTRSHSLYVQPYRQPHFFGYNQPVADEFKKRYGIDIRKFDYMDNRATSEGHFAAKDIMFCHEYEYVGAEKFDLKAWHDLKGESVRDFMREVRKIMGPKAHLALEASHWACPPKADPEDPICAKMFFYPAEWAQEGTINEWVLSQNWRGSNFAFDSEVLPAFQPVRDAGCEINVWLNDIFSPTGGDTSTPATPKAVEEYLNIFLESGQTSATIHEADFLIQNPKADEMWKFFRRWFGK